MEFYLSYAEKRGESQNPCAAANNFLFRFWSVALTPVERNAGEIKAESAECTGNTDGHH